MGKARVGVSGWSYDGWQGDFFPDDLAKSRRLEYVASRFDTVEVNGSFYSLLTAKTYRSWYEQTPAAFRFALKGSRFITHNKKLSDARGPLANFFASGLLALGEKLGPIVWQLPRTLRFDEDRLASFLELLPRDTTGAARLAEEHDHRVRDPLTEAPGRHHLRHAVEPRHESFFAERAARVLRDHGVALAVSHAGDWEMAEEVTAGFVYVRLHGSPTTYRSRYGEDALEGWAEKVRAWLGGRNAPGARRLTGLAPPRRKSFDVYVYFDNDGWGHAPWDALALAERVAGR